MRTVTLTVALVIIGSPLFGQEPHSKDEAWKPDAGFVSLFNGKDLSGWCFRKRTPKKETRPGDIIQNLKGKTQSDDQRYSVKNNTLIVSFPNERDRLTARLYTVAEFPENFELKLEFRASVNADSGIFIRKPQLQCRDYLVAGPYKKLKHYRPQEWNSIKVIVKDGVASCTCNGEVLEQALKLPKTGPIGLEGDRGQIEYRHLQLKKLPSTESSSN